MKKGIFLASLIFFLVSTNSFSDEITAKLKAALDEIGKSHYEVLRVGFGNFTYEYSSLAGSFSRFIEEKLKDAIAQSDYFEFFAQDALENLDLSFKEVYGGLFSAEGLEALLKGRYFEEGDSIRVTLEVISFKTGLLVGRGEAAIDKADIPGGISLIPPDYRRARELGMELEEVVEAAESDFQVQATTNRGDGAVFHDGEEMVLHFFSSRDAYIKVFHIDVNGKVKLIFPNRYYADNFVPGQTLVQIPGKGHPFSFVLGKPYGTEFIKVMASASQFKDIEESFKDLGQASKERLTRGLTVEQRQGDLAEKLIRYTIVE